MIYHQDINKYAITHDKQVAATSETVFVEKDKVSYAYSEMRTGINRYSGKRWYRWETTAVRGFRRNHNGSIVAYNRVKTGRLGWINRGLGPVFDMLNLRPDFKRAVSETLGVDGLASIYPVAGMYGVESYEHIPASIRRQMRNTDMRGFSAEVFGKKNLRRDIIRSAAQSNPGAVAVASTFRGLVPPDWIAGYMHNSPKNLMVDGRGNAIYPWGVAFTGTHTRNILMAVNQRSLKHLLGEELTPQRWNVIRDIDYMARRNRLNPADVANNDRIYRTWEELHDDFVGHNYYRRRVAVESEITLTDMAKSLDGLKAGRFTIIPAKHTSEMRAWGEEMRNCIAGYASVAVSGSGVYAGVYEGGRLKANLEIRSGKLTQLLGKANSVLPEDAREAVTGALKSAGVTVPANYWGASERF